MKYYLRTSRLIHKAGCQLYEKSRRKRRGKKRQLPSQDMADLKIKSVIGFSGKVAGALNYSPCGNYMVYPLGSFVVLKNVKTDKECFLDGHSHEISCLSVSKDGKWIASGQINIIGVKVSSFFLIYYMIK